MQYALHLLSRYNQRVNNNILSILDSLDQNSLSEPRKVYFDSIIGTLNHNLFADSSWMLNLSKYNLPEVQAVVPRIPKMHFENFTSVPYESLGQFRPLRVAMDSILVDFIDLVPQSRLEEYIDYVDWENKSHSYRLGSLLMHLFNHQTHHRGTISALLDQMGIENDFSNILLMLGDIEQPAFEGSKS